jgi:hypothetical protein
MNVVIIRTLYTVFNWSKSALGAGSRGLDDLQLEGPLGLL